MDQRLEVRDKDGFDMPLNADQPTALASYLQDLLAATPLLKQRLEEHGLLAWKSQRQLLGGCLFAWRFAAGSTHMLRCLSVSWSLQLRGWQHAAQMHYWSSSDAMNPR